MKFKEIFNKIKSLIKEKYRLASMLNLKTAVCILFLFLLWSLFFNNHGTYKSMPELNIERAYHQSILIDEQNVLITGGINSSDNQKIGMKSAELYNIKGNKRSEILNTNIPHLFHSLFKMDDGNILIADINGIEVFDINNKKFRLLKTKPMPRHPEFYNTKFALLPNNLLLITGGRAYTRNSEHLKNLGYIEIIDIKKDKLIKTIKFDKSGSGLASLPNGNVVIVGGLSQDTSSEKLSDKIYLFDYNKLEINLIGKTYEPIFNPFVFANSDNILTIIGGEIFDKYKPFRNFNYILLTGSKYLQTIDLDKNTIKTKNMIRILKHSVFNQILDVISIGDNKYFMQLRTIRCITNAMIFDTKKNKSYKIKGALFNNPPFFRTSNLKTPNGILITGGKEDWEELTQYSIYSEEVPSAEQKYNPCHGGGITNRVLLIK